MDFNSRPHEEVDCFRRIFLVTYLIFQLTTSRRGRPVLGGVLCQFIVISTHDLTKRSTIAAMVHYGQILDFNSRPHEEVDHRQKQRDYRARVFQLTTSRRGRLLPWSWWPGQDYFNSRPHEEVDAERVLCTCSSRISTHDLTKRSTICHYGSTL